MPIPGYLWLYDDGGSHIKGSVDVQGRKVALKLLVLAMGLISLWTRQTVKLLVLVTIHRS